MQIVEHALNGGDSSHAGPRRQSPGKAAIGRPAGNDGPDPMRELPIDSSDTAATPAVPEANRLLGALAPSAYAELLREGELVTLAHGQVVYRTGAPTTDVYFPHTAVFSMVREMADGSGVEVGTVGREGVVGAGVLWGATSTSTRCIAQIPGRAYRIPVAALRAAVTHAAVDGADTLGRGAALGDLLSRYALALFEQVTQTAACNRMHALDQRCARWLLMTHDRVDGDELALTQEFLSYMLGVRRAGVTEACGALQRSGLIHYRHGHITVVDRAGLEAAACECYGVAADAYTELLGALVDRPPSA
jgi:CRP-like cAMP-binding protein